MLDVLVLLESSVGDDGLMPDVMKDDDEIEGMMPMMMKNDDELTMLIIKTMEMMMLMMGMMFRK